METYKEYRMMMYRNGKWEWGKNWSGYPLGTRRSREACLEAIEAVRKGWHSYPYKPFPKWKIESREVTVTEWNQDGEQIKGGL